MRAQVYRTGKFDWTIELLEDDLTTGLGIHYIIGPRWYARWFAERKLKRKLRRKKSYDEESFTILPKDLK